MDSTKSDIVFMRSNRVTLRPLAQDDIPLLTRWINDPEVIQYLNAYLPMMETEEENWLQNMQSSQHSDICFAIVVDEKMIGNMGIHNIDWRHRTAVTGTIIGEKEYWGYGYGTEAKMLLLAYAFNTLNLRKIRSSVLAFNERSHRYSMKCGYKEEGRLKEQLFRHGQYWDEILLAVFKDNWLPLWEQFEKEHRTLVP